MASDRQGLELAGVPNILNASLFSITSHPKVNLLDFNSSVKQYFYDFFFVVCFLKRQYRFSELSDSRAEYSFACLYPRQMLEGDPQQVGEFTLLEKLLSATLQVSRSTRFHFFTSISTALRNAVVTPSLAWSNRAIQCRP